MSISVTKYCERDYRFFFWWENNFETILGKENLKADAAIYDEVFLINLEFFLLIDLLFPLFPFA